MPAIGFIILFVEIAFAIHAIKRDEWNWVFLILFIPLIGCLLYAILVLMPEAKLTRGGAGVFPGRKRGTGRSKKFSVVKSSSSVDALIKSAQQYVQDNNAGRAIAIYKESLSGQFAGNPRLMLELAKAYFKQHRFSEVRDTLDELIKVNPDFRSTEGHLLYARAQEALGNIGKAHAEYQALIQYSSDLPVLCAYAVFLNKQNESQQAKPYLERILADADLMSRQEKESNRKWINAARHELRKW